MRAAPSILIIEDNDFALDVLSQLLPALGAGHVACARSAEVALEILRSQKFSANSRSLLSGSACVLGDRAVDQFHQIRDAGDCILTRNGRKRGHHSTASSLRYSALPCSPLSACSKTFTISSAAWPWGGFLGCQ